MFCDMAGSTELANKLDPEDHGEILAAYQAACTTEIARMGGMVAQYLGDGVLAYFGYPAAHEDDADRAIRAGLGLLERLRARTFAPDISIRTRVGIATGRVVVGDLVHVTTTQEHAAVGPATNLASRIQQLAPPDAVVVDDTTYQLVGNSYEFGAVQRVPIKGFPQPVAVRHVLGPSHIESRLEARRNSARHVMIGRRGELERLLACWNEATAGRGRLALISGEPGIGKSLLMRELRRRIGTEPATTLAYHCSPFHSESALYPIVRQILRTAGIATRVGGAELATNVAELLRQSNIGKDHHIALLAMWLLAAGSQREVAGLAPEQIKERTLAALVARLQQLAGEQPIIALFEDLQWIDPTSLELLMRVVDRLPQLRMLVIASARPEFKPPWSTAPHIVEIGLDRLEHDDARTLVANAADNRPMPRGSVELVLSHADGIPLFLEELTRSVIEGGLTVDPPGQSLQGDCLPVSALPATLQGALLARLDRLAEAKPTAQVASVIGRDFAYAVLASASGAGDDDLRCALDQLVDAGLLLQSGSPPYANYRFKHALVQDVAYASLTKSKRRELHARLADQLAVGMSASLVAEPETIGRHYAESGRTAEAVRYYAIAGNRELRRSSMEEAARQFERALQLLGGLPASADRDKSELDLLVGLCLALTSGRGFATPAAGDVLQRATSLSHRLGDSANFMRISYARYFHHLMRGEVARSHDVASQLRAHFERTKSPDALILAQRTIGVTHFESGDLTAARSALDHADALLRERSETGSATQRESAVMIQTWLGHILALQGYPDQARERRAIYLGAKAPQISSYIECFAMGFAASLALLLRDYGDLLARARSMDAFLREHKFPELQVANSIFMGCARMQHGDGAGADQVRLGLDSYRKSGARWSMPYWLAAFADALYRRRDGEAVAVLEQAFASMNELDERWFEPELHRLRGDLIVARLGGLTGSPESQYLAAIDLARSQGSRLLELRAATSLAILMRRTGRTSEARNVLAPYRSVLIEGADLPDVMTTNAMLASEAS